MACSYYLMLQESFFGMDPSEMSSLCSPADSAESLLLLLIPQADRGANKWQDITDSLST